MLWSSQAVEDHLLLILLVLPWPSQAVDVQVPLVLLVLRWCCGRFKVFDDRVLLQRCFPFDNQLQLLSAGELPFSFSYEKKYNHSLESRQVDFFGWSEFARYSRLARGPGDCQAVWEPSAGPLRP